MKRPTIKCRFNDFAADVIFDYKENPNFLLSELFPFYKNQQTYYPTEGIGRLLGISGGELAAFYRHNLPHGRDIYYSQTLTPDWKAQDPIDKTVPLRETSFINFEGIFFCCIAGAEKIPGAKDFLLRILKVGMTLGAFHGPIFSGNIYKKKYEKRSGRPFIARSKDDSHVGKNKTSIWRRIFGIFFPALRAGDPEKAN